MKRNCVSFLNWVHTTTQKFASPVLSVYYSNNEKLDTIYVYFYKTFSFSQKAIKKYIKAFSKQILTNH